MVYEELFPLVLETESPERIEAPEERVESVAEIEPVVEAAPEAAREPEAGPGPHEDREPSLAIEAIIEELFPENQTANVAAEIFEQHHLDHHVRGSGRLQRVERYFSDRFFGSDPGARATLVVREPSASAFGVRAIQVVLQLDAEEEALLQERVGETVAFEGRLVHCDPYLHNLVIAEADIR